MDEARSLGKPALLRIDIVVDFVGHQVTLRVIEDHVSTSHHFTGSLIEGSLVRRHVHVFIDDIDVPSQMVGVLVFLL